MNTSTNNAQLAAATVNDPRWTSVVARAPEADGTFYYSVQTTGVYCLFSREVASILYLGYLGWTMFRYRSIQFCKFRQHPMVEGTWA